MNELQKHYEALPTITAPKSEFVRKIANACRVNEMTVRLWIKGKTKPYNPEHVKIIADILGVEPDQVFLNYYTLKREV